MPFGNYCEWFNTFVHYVQTQLHDYFYPVVLAKYVYFGITKSLYPYEIEMKPCLYKATNESFL